MNRTRMTFRVFTILCSALALAWLAAPQPASAEDSSSQGSPAWDNAVNSLLATGMYGLAGPEGEGFSIHLDQAKNPYRGVAADNVHLGGQAITFSYDGSAGLLGFSAGYILTSEPTREHPGAVFLGIDPVDRSRFNPDRSWYMALDLSSSYQIDDSLSLGIGTSARLMQNPFDTDEGKLFSMLFNMPVNYKDYLTITPQFQWTRELPELPESLKANNSSKSKDSFYGGVSISFSY